MRTIALYAFGSLDSAHAGYMSLFPVVFTLQHIRVYICTSNSGDKVSYIEFPIDEALGLCSALCVPYVDPDNGHV